MRSFAVDDRGEEAQDDNDDATARTIDMVLLLYPPGGILRGVAVRLGTNVCAEFTPGSSDPDPIPIRGVSRRVCAGRVLYWYRIQHQYHILFVTTTS